MNMFKRACFILIVLCLCIQPLFADKEDNAKLNLKNAWFNVEIDTQRGGRISSLVFPDDGGQWISPGNCGILMDHVAQQEWPGELLSRKYEYCYEDETSDYFGVKLWTVLEGKGDESISGLRLEKTIRVYKKKPLIEAVYKLSNPTNVTKRPILWIQNLVSPKGRELGRSTYRPTSRGVLRTVYDADSNIDSSKDFRFDPVDGWMAVLDEQTKTGLIFYMDYNWLKCLYSNQGAYTQEWWYDAVLLPPTKTFETTVKLWYIKGLDSVEHADENVVASLNILRNEKKATSSLRLVKGPEGIGSANINLSLQEYPNKVIKGNTGGRVDMNGVSPVLLQTDGKDISEKTDLQVEAKIETESGTKSFNVFNSGVAILFTETQWRVPKPRKIRKVFKPENISKKRNETIQVLHLKGLFSYLNRWDEIVSCLGGELKIGRYGSGAHGADIKGFPKDYDELMGFDIIVVDNVPADGIDDDSVELLRDFVSNGGLLIVYGSDMLARVNERLPQDLLAAPVATLSSTRRLDCPIPLDVNKPAAGYWQYALKDLGMIEGAKVIVESKGYPVVVSRKIKKGATAVFYPLSLGKLSEVDGYWKATAYPEWMSVVVSKLLNETEIYGELQK